MTKEMMKQARKLEEYKDTPEAEENYEAYEEFKAWIEGALDAGEITAAEYNELASIALFDYEPVEE